MKFRTTFQDRQTGESALNCLSQGHSRMARVVFYPDHVDDYRGALDHLTTQPTFESERFYFEGVKI